MRDQLDAAGKMSSSSAGMKPPQPTKHGGGYEKAARLAALYIAERWNELDSFIDELESNYTFSSIMAKHKRKL